MSKPREFWILTNPDYDVQSWAHHSAYDTKQNYTEAEQVHVREVTPKDESMLKEAIELIRSVELAEYTRDAEMNMALQWRLKYIPEGNRKIKT